MRIRTSSLAFVVGFALTLAAAGCTSHGYARGSGGSKAAGTTNSISLNRGDWLMGEQAGVWKVMAQQRTGAPQRLGYVTERHYKEMRGGPTFTLYEVTGLDRDQPIGMVDSLGNATRYRPRRGGGFDTEDAGNSTLLLSVGAIFDTVRPLELDKTTERALAFEVLDVNHDGYLDKAEFPRITDRVHSPDTNHDGKIDAGEFNAADSL